MLLYIMWFFFFDTYTGSNPLLSIAIVYILEKAFKQLRRWLGRRNLVKKSMFDDRFLM